MAGKAKRIYRAEAGESLELRPVGEALTGVQAVVAVGILHLRHPARGEKFIRCPPGGSAPPLTVGTDTHGCAGN